MMGLLSRAKWKCKSQEMFGTREGYKLATVARKINR